MLKLLDGPATSKRARNRIDRYLRKHDPLLGGAKNRLGQKARRALYEKKYGAKANHLARTQQQQAQAQAAQQQPAQVCTQRGRLGA